MTDKIILRIQSGVLVSVPPEWREGGRKGGRKGEREREGGRESVCVVYEHEPQLMICEP